MDLLVEPLKLEAQLVAMPYCGVEGLLATALLVRERRRLRGLDADLELARLLDESGGAWRHRPLTRGERSYRCADGGTHGGEYAA